MCSVLVINSDRTWIEPWRFITYGFVHNSWSQFLLNVTCLLVFGLPMELSHGSISVASVFLSGIFLAGLGREIVSNNNKPLAGTTGEVTIPDIILFRN